MQALKQEKKRCVSKNCLTLSSTTSGRYCEKRKPGVRRYLKLPIPNITRPCAACRNSSQRFALLFCKTPESGASEQLDLNFTVTYLFRASVNRGAQACRVEPVSQAGISGGDRRGQ